MNLPTGFHSWQEDAQKAFLLEARAKSEIVEWLTDELDTTNPTDKAGAISHELVVELLYEVNDDL
jgi:hypothetical protein